LIAGLQLAGGINLARDARKGRNFEHLSENPLLARRSPPCRRAAQP
jgi:beta-glucosidase-like glycosyl hydrolase